MMFENAKARLVNVVTLGLVMACLTRLSDAQTAKTITVSATAQNISDLEKLAGRLAGWLAARSRHSPELARRRGWQRRCLYSDNVEDPPRHTTFSHFPRLYVAAKFQFRPTASFSL